MVNLFSEAKESLTQAAIQAEEEISKLRVKRGKLLEEVSFLENGPLPKDEWIKRAEQAVDRLGEDHDLAGLRRVRMAHSGPEALADFLNADPGYDLKKDMAPLLACLFPKQIKDRIRALIKDQEWESGPPMAERPQRIAELKQQLTKLEREEEAFIESAEEAGITIRRRADVDPAIVLNKREIEEESEETEEEANAAG